MTKLTFYGNVKMLRDYCDDCGAYALVRDNALLCCGASHEKSPTKIHRMCEPDGARKQPSPADKASILRMQNDRCYYCDRRFGSHYVRSGRQRTLRVHWDHEIPWVFSQNNSSDNFVAACNVCNLLKSDRCFEGPDAARAYLAFQWERRGYANKLSFGRHSS